MIAAGGVDNLGIRGAAGSGARGEGGDRRRRRGPDPEKASLFINIGTTTEEVAKALQGRTGLLVITNNLNVVDILASSPGVEVIVVGGRVRAADRASVGAFAVDFIRNFKVDFAIIGASAMDEDGSLLDFDINEVQVSQTIIQRLSTGDPRRRRSKAWPPRARADRPVHRRRPRLRDRSAGQSGPGGEMRSAGRLGPPRRARARAAPYAAARPRSCEHA
ncbi:DeoR/GlpR family DNA-binding transcription regulator [Caulobacter segnis]